MAKDVRVKIKIDTETAQLENLNNKINATKGDFNSAGSMASAFTSKLGLIGGAIGGLYLVSNVLSLIKNRGLEVNKEFQKLTNSLAMSNAAIMANYDNFGNAVSITEKYRLAQIEAAKTTEMLQEINIRTPHSMKETVQIYDAMFLGMKKVGATSKDMVEITEKLSIAAGNKIGFDAFLAAMDGIANGTVMANSEMGRFLNSIGLSNEAIKNSTDVVQLFKDKLAGFKAIDDWDTKMSNLSNSTDMLSKNLMKMPFDWLETKIPIVAGLFDDWAKSVNEINVYIANASDLKTYDQLINKQYQLLGQIAEVKNNKFMWDSEQKEKLTELNKELEIVFVKLSQIREDEDKLKNIGTVFDSSEIDKLVEKTLNPYSSKVDEINNKWLINYNLLEKNGQDTTKLVNAWTKELENFEDSENKKTNKEVEKDLKEQKKSLEDLQTAYKDIAQIGMSEYEKALVSIEEQTKSWLEAGVSTNNALVAQNKLLDELNTKKAIDTEKEDLSYYERLVQLKSDSYEKELELANISYSQKNLDIQGSNKPLEDKQKLIDLETELYYKTIERLGVEQEIKDIDLGAEKQLEMIDYQMQLLDATDMWDNSLKGVAKTVGNVLGSYNKMQKISLESNKKQIKLDTDLAKVKKNFGAESAEYLKAESEYTLDNARLKEETQNAEIAGYAALAGAMVGAFEQGSAGAIAFSTLQATLGIASSWTAIAQAWALPFPANLGAVAMVSAAVMPIISQLTSMGGGGSSSSSSISMPKMVDINEANINAEYNPMIGRLDRQIEILEKIERNGSAAALGVELSKKTFEKDYKLFANENIYGGGLLTGANGLLPIFNPLLYVPRASNGKTVLEDYLGFNVGKTTANGFELSDDLFKDMNFMKLIEAVNKGMITGTNWEAIFATDWQKSGIDGSVRAKIAEVTEDFQDILHTYSINLLDTMDELKDAKQTFKNKYDELTGTSYYSDMDLKDSFDSLNQHLKGKPLTQYLQDEIENIKKLENWLTEDKIKILLMQDPTKLNEQLKLIEELREQTGYTFQNGAEEALNYLDAIEQVAETMATSQSNIKDFYNGFKDETQRLNDLSNSLNLKLPTTLEELAQQFVDLKNDTFGLTDEELNYLQSAKDYLENKNKELLDSQKEGLEEQINLQEESLNNIKNSMSKLENIVDIMNSTIDKLKGSVQGSSYTLTKFYKSMNESLILSKTEDYESFEKSLKDTISYSNSLFEKSNFNSLWDMQFAQSVATKQFETMQDTTLTEIDYLKKIEENTSDLVDDLKGQLDSFEDAITSTFDEFVQYVKEAEYKKFQYGQAYVPSFAVGTTDVPYNMLAQIHKSEMILPATFSNGVRKGDLNIGNNKEQIELLKEIREILKKIDLKVEDIDDREDYKLRQGA